MERTLGTHILHPTDTSAASTAAFAHALALVLKQRAHLTMMHLKRGVFGAGHEGFPGVRDTLIRWGQLGPGSRRSDVTRKLGVRVKKITLRSYQTAARISEYLSSHPVDLLVLAIRRKEGLPRWLRHTALDTSTHKQGALAVLCVPTATAGFVSLQHGTSNLKRILMPVTKSLDPQFALAYAEKVIDVFGGEAATVTLLTVNEPAPDVSLPTLPGVTWKQVEREGDVVQEILHGARRRKSQLVIMPSSGRKGLFETLSGSTTEQVLHDIPCPVLIVPT